MEESYQRFDKAIFTFIHYRCQCPRFYLYFFTFLIALYWFICFQNNFVTLPQFCNITFKRLVPSLIKKSLQVLVKRFIEGNGQRVVVS